MSGGESWAITLPSTNSTIEWTMLSGWTTTSICSGFRSNSQRASMTSSALFIRVAESIVIFGPICQVGCLRACSGVTSSSSRRVLPRNGPPEEVRITRRTSRGSPGAEALEDRRVLAVDRQQRRLPLAGQLGDQRAADDQRLLVRQGDRLARLQRRPGPFEPGGADDRRTGRVSTSGSWTIRTRPSRPIAELGPEAVELAVDLRGGLGVGQGDPAGAVASGLLDELLPAASAPPGRSPGAVGRRRARSRSGRSGRSSRSSRG